MNSQSPITDIIRLNSTHTKALAKLGMSTIEDILYHFPARYGDVSEIKNIASLTTGELAVIFGTIGHLKTGKAYRAGTPMSTATITDESGSIGVVWFHQPYIAKMIQEGSIVRIEGKVSQRKDKLYFSNPKVESVTKVPIGVGASLFGADAESHTLYPVYPETQGITSNWIYHTLVRIFNSDVLNTITDPIPSAVLEKYNLPSIKTALIWIHSPQKISDAEAARKRFAFQEIFMIQLRKAQERANYQKNPAFVIDRPSKDIEEFIKRFPFSATEGQRSAIDAVLQDFQAGHAMSRLLHGDVGSGKTAVAATTAYSVITTRPKNQSFGRLQVAYMCPTEILASQHFESFIQYFAYLGIQVGLITGSGCKKFPSKVNPRGWTDISRTQLLKWVANGEIPILIGTHALIQKAVKFKNLAYVIIDEQHRFGTGQRQKLVRKDGITPHLLSMSATPIPRTLALTIYGDLDISVLDQMPAGRKPVITEVVLPTARDATYASIRAALAAGRQLYVICPRIDEHDPTKELTVNAKSVTEEAKRLKKTVFPEYTIGILHSKMSSAAKDKVMNDFSRGTIHILVATSVVEVGVNVPNATMIIIEGAERFGLAQLHQLRGRVLRGTHQAYCYIFAETKTQKTLDRLKAFTTAKNGFELAEFDLAQRGAGVLYSGKQWGLSDLAMDALKNIKMVEAARTEAHTLITNDPTLTHYPLLSAAVAASAKDIHFE